MKSPKLFIINIFRPAFRKAATPLAKLLSDTPLIIGDRKRLKIGSRVAIKNALINLSSGNVEISDRVILAHGVMLITGEHKFINGTRASLIPDNDDGSWGGGRAEVPESGNDIFIGTGSFIGAGAIILGDVKIGKHCIVGAGAVVTKSIADHAIVAGVPAKIIGSTLNYT